MTSVHIHVHVCEMQSHCTVSLTEGLMPLPLTVCVSLFLVRMN